MAPRNTSQGPSSAGSPGADMQLELRCQDSERRRRQQIRSAPRQEEAGRTKVQHEQDKMKLITQTSSGCTSNPLTRSRKTSKAFEWRHASSPLVLHRRRRSRGNQLRTLCLLLIGVAASLTRPIGCQSTDESSGATTTTTTTASTQPTPVPAGANSSLDPLDPHLNSNEASSGSSAMNAVTKLKPINFTLVDEIFESTLADDEVVKRWKNMDAQFQDGIRSILKLVFPQIVAISQDAKVSGDCSGGILKWILSLRNLRSWAIKMLDATGKPTAGIFEGSLTMFGNYRQCLSIRAPDEDEIEITDQFEEYFRGQFCVIHLKPWMPAKRPFYHLNSTIESLLRRNYKYYEKTLYDELAEIAVAFNFIDIRMDLCVPSTCTMADIQRVADLLSRKLEMRSKVMRCDTSPRESAALTVSSQLDRLTTATWSILPVTLACLVVICTVLDALDLTRGASNKLSALFRCFTIREILRLRLSIPRSEEATITREEQLAPANGGLALWTLRKPLPLYGLRNVFVFWFIIVQMTVELKYQYLRESLVLRNMLLSYWPFQIIINSTLLFDSIILITAFTYSYSNLESTFKELIGYIFDKYLRLIPSLIAVIALTIFTPLIAIESPVWKNYVEQQADVCKSTGYLDLFFLQNFISYEKICIPHTWLLCVEFQLVLISIPLIILLKKIFIHSEDSLIIEQSEKIDQVKATSSSASSSPSRVRSTLLELIKSQAGLIGLALIASGVLINFFLVYLNQLPPSWFFTFPDVNQKNYYFGKYLSKTWVHLTSFFIGLFGGHLCRSTFQLNNLRLIRSRRATTASSASSSSSTSSPSGQFPHQQQDSLCGFQSADSSQSIVSLTANQTSQTEIAKQSSSRRARDSREGSTFSFGLVTGALVCMFAIIFSTYSWSTNETPSALVAALYDSVSRLIWSLGLVIVMIQLCLPDWRTSKYTPMGQFFSHRAFIVLGRLSFLAYLLAPYVHNFVLAVEEQPMFPSLFLIFHVIVGNIVITYSVAFVTSILIEQPIRLALQRLIGQTGRSSASYCMPQQTAIGMSKQQGDTELAHEKQLDSQHANDALKQSGPEMMAPGH